MSARRPAQHPLLTHVLIRRPLDSLAQGNDVPAPIRAFADIGTLGVAPRVVQQLQSFGFEEPSPIQVCVCGCV